jgi:hypothetical protein
MPFLRFSRDKRGYENTYLCHTFRGGRHAGLRVLYWFRTPPDVKVGRLALDPAAIRSIEESNPDLKFDWDKILKVKPPPPPQDYGREGRDERRRRRRDANAERDKVTPGTTATSEKVAAPESVGAPDSGAEAAEAKSVLEGPEADLTTWDDPGPGSEPAATPPGGSGHIVLALTDEQGLARLRARHAEIQARISDRVRDPSKLEQIRAQAALLDPDAWRTVDEARERLASLAETTDAIRKVLGRRRRTRRGGARRRRPRQPDGGETSGAAAGGAEKVREADGGAEASVPDVGLASDQSDE